MVHRRSTRHYKTHIATGPGALALSLGILVEKKKQHFGKGFSRDENRSLFAVLEER